MQADQGRIIQPIRRPYMELRHYETFYLLHPDLTDEERASISEQLQEIISKKNGKTVKIDPWPLQKLAYMVKKQTQGYYVVMEYGMPSESVSEITRKLQLNEGVMKFITIKLNDKFDPEAPAKARNESAPPAETVEEALDPDQSVEKREKE
ncbi:MAG: 30S ribosomal protein S6 [Thermodesulfobacteriota bacterium]|nr:MAG: 30S ribosomal protein S6 [Thermodesulfobacteriota bacterium]